MGAQTQEEAPYTGRILPGSNWLTRTYAAHNPYVVSVERVGPRSVRVVIAYYPGGGGSGHDKQRVGRRFNVLTETFLRTHTLVSQPKGYQPGDEGLAAPRVDTVETYFRRRRYAQEWIDHMEGDDIRAGVLDPRLSATRQPVYVGDAFVPPPPPEFPELNDRTPPPTKEEPMSNEPEVITATDEQLLETLHQIEAKEVEYLKQPGEQGVSIPPGVITTIPAAPTEEADPVETFLASGRAVVEKLTRELIAVADQRDVHLAAAEELDARYQVVKANRNRIESAVLAAMSTTEGPDLGPAEPVEPEPTPHTQRHGPLPATQGTQRSWTLDRLAQDGTIHVGSVADEFAAAFGLTRESAIKNLASILGDQVNRPNPQWPTAMRTSKGSYTAIVNG